MPRTARTQTERRAATQAAVLKSAIKLFGKQGYHQTSLEDIAADCGTTIRPIYHYYKNKKQLFQVVTETVELELVAALEAVENDPELKAGITNYWQAFIDLAKQPGFRQIVLIDAPHILGRDRWRDTPVVKKSTDLIEKLQPELSASARQLFTRMLIGALTEAALVFAENKAMLEDGLLESILEVLAKK